jgi:hypothetical protein
MLPSTGGTASITNAAGGSSILTSINMTIPNALFSFYSFNLFFLDGDATITATDNAYPSGDGRLSSVGLIWRDCAVVQTPVFAPVQETVRWQVSRYWPVLSDVAGGASSRSRRL